MAQVDDVALAAARADAAPGSLCHPGRSAVPEKCFIDIALKDELWVPFPRCGEIVPAAKADDVGSRDRHLLQVRTLLDEQNARDAAHFCENLLVVRLSPHGVFLRLQQPGPGVE